MKFSIKVQYGLQSLLELALSYGSGPRQMGEIASEQKIPVRFLEQLMLLLKRSGIAVSTRGMCGGYTLAKHPGDISLLEVIETLDGPIELATKKMKRNAILFDAFEKLQEDIRQSLKDLTLEDLVMRKRQKDRAYTYNI